LILEKDYHFYHLLIYHPNQTFLPSFTFWISHYTSLASTHNQLTIPLANQLLGNKLKHLLILVTIHIRLVRPQQRLLLLVEALLLEITNDAQALLHRIRLVRMNVCVNRVAPTHLPHTATVVAHMPVLRATPVIHTGRDTGGKAVDQARAPTRAPVAAPIQQSPAYRLKRADLLELLQIHGRVDTHLIVMGRVNVEELGVALGINLLTEEYSHE